MKYTNIADLKVSKLCLGCMGFGEAQAGMHQWTLGYEASKEIILEAYKNGINFFDTAMGYSNGTSEEFLGRALKEGNIKREDVIIATKFVPRINMNITMKEHIQTCLNNSLKRLGMDYIDLYILHWWDENTPIEETLEALNEVIEAGKVRQIGISNCFAYQLALANQLAKERGWHSFVSVQGHHNLIFREEEREMDRYCKEYNVASTPYSALAAGRLSKRPNETSARLQLDNYAKGKYDATAQSDALIIERVMEIADKHAVSMSEVALRWLMGKVTSPVVGATKLSHIAGLAKACDLELSEEEIHYLEECYTPHELVGMMKKD